MSNNVLGETWYKDLSVSETYKNFLTKYPVFGIVRWLFLGLFGFIFKMSIRINRTIRDPETKKLKWDYLAVLVIAFIAVVSAISLGYMFAI